MDTHLHRALDLAQEATNVEVFTGAGMSAESGLDTFRSTDTGLWDKVDPAAMASIDSWARDPDPMWAWYLWRAQLCINAAPNAGHEAIARWAKLPDRDVGVITQNIDNLHERGGMDDVVHLHGSLFDFRCTICSRPYATKRVLEALPSEPMERLSPPECPLCGNPVRPGVVWFGEALPTDAWDEAEARMYGADLVVIVGTSGVVQPAASLPLIAAELGTPILEITPAPTDLSGYATFSWPSTAAQALPQLVDALSTPSG